MDMKMLADMLTLRADCWQQFYDFNLRFLILEAYFWHISMTDNLQVS